MLPRRLGIHDKFIPNAVLNPSFMPLLVVKDLIVALNLNSPKSDAPKEMPNFNLGAILLRKSFPKECLFPIETIVVTCSHSTKFLHDEGGPPPSSPCLDAVPKFMLDRLTCAGKTKNTLL